MNRIRIENLRNPVTKEDFESREEVTKGYMGLWFFFDEKKTLMFGEKEFSLIFQGVVIWGNKRESSCISFLTDSIDGVRITRLEPNDEQLSKVLKEIIFFDSSKVKTISSNLCLIGNFKFSIKFLLKHLLRW